MPILNSITGNTWPLSGTATAGTTGLNAISGTNLVHVASTDIPASSLATGYINSFTENHMTTKKTDTSETTTDKTVTLSPEQWQQVVSFVDRGAATVVEELSKQPGQLKQIANIAGLANSLVEAITAQP